MVALYSFLCLVLEPRPRNWIYLGISLGVGLEVKYTIGALAVAIGIAILFTPVLRLDLRTRYPWIAASIALLIWVPNLAWQVEKGFPSLVYIANHQGSGGGLVANVILIVVYLFFLIPLWVAGLVSLFRSAITPPDRIHRLGLDAKNELFKDSVGWEDVAHEVESIYGNLPSSERTGTIIISAFYGVPGALRIYGDKRSLPVIVSPQLSGWYWLPRDLVATNALMVDYEPSDVAWMCSSAILVGHLTVPYGVQGLEQGAPVTFCVLKGPISQDWRRLRNFS